MEILSHNEEIEIRSNDQGEKKIGKKKSFRGTKEQKGRTSQKLCKKMLQFASKEWQNLISILKNSNMHELKVASERQKKDKLSNTIQITIEQI